MIASITGVILAGGKSSRMGTNKALLPYEGRTLVESVVDRMRAIFPRVVLSVQQPEDYPQLNLPKLADHYPETGPMGAVASILEEGEDRIFVVACDMPFVNPDLVAFLCGFDDCDAVVPVWHGRMESLHAVYSRTLLPSFQQLLGEGRFKIADGFLQEHVRYVTEEEIRRLDPKGDSFRNVNTPEDYDLL